jgi:choline monooxygenase
VLTTYPRASWSVAVGSAELETGHAFPVQVGDLPVVLYRMTDGTVRGWLNICPHRSAPLATGPTRCDRLRCPYHGWTFDLDGQLIRTPWFGGEPGPHPLTPVAVHEDRGFVWVHPEAGTPAPTELVSALTREGAPDVGSWELFHREEHPIEASWSVYVENYLDAYHIPFIHPELSREVGLDDYEVRVFDGFVTHVVPPRDGSVSAGFWAWIWPNTMLNVYDGGLNIERVLPMGPDRCRITYTYLFRQDVPEEQRRRSIDLSGTITAEDVAICEAVQRNLSTGLAPQGALSPTHENGVAAFRAWLAHSGAANGPRSDRNR